MKKQLSELTIEELQQECLKRGLVAVPVEALYLMAVIPPEKRDLNELPYLLRILPGIPEPFGGEQK